MQRLKWLAGILILAVAASANFASGAATARSVAPRVAPLDGTMTSIACPSTTDCLASGAQVGLSSNSGTAIYRSKDHSASWARVTVPAGAGGFSAVACASRTTCVAVGYNTKVTAGVIILSADGGATWHRVAVPAIASKLLSVTCPTPTWCQASGLHYVPTTDGSLITSGVELQSLDGGKTWHSQTLPFNISIAESVSCLPSGSCLLVGADGQISGQVGAMSTTTDRGATWLDHDDLVHASMLTSATCVTAAFCVEVGVSASLASSVAYLSTVSGSIFKSVPVARDVDQLAWVGCWGAAHCFATGYSASTSYADLTQFLGSGNGVHFGVVTTPHLADINGLSCAQLPTCIAVGDIGNDPYHPTTLISRNSGSTWSQSGTPH